MDFMARNLQPIVGIGQQLIVIGRSRTVQPMVAKAQEEQKSQFAKRLKDALDVHPDAPKAGYGRAAWIVKLLKDRKILKISNQAVQKWLKGESSPSHTNLSILCELTGIRMQYFIDGSKPIFASSTSPEPLRLADDEDHFGPKLSRIWSQLTEEVRGQIYAFALIHATTLPESKKRATWKERSSHHGK